MISRIETLKGITTYSEGLGLNLREPAHRFQWFLASILFAKRISSAIAQRTFKLFQEEKLVTPQAILAAGWDKLVQVLDVGGYVRYDFSTASNLLVISNQLLEKFGSLDKLHAYAESPEHLEKLLMEFKGVGPVGVNIFLRELRGIWEKADPPPSPLALQVAKKLGIKEIKDVEAQLVRINLEYCKKGLCHLCPAKTMCAMEELPH